MRGQIFESRVHSLVRRFRWFNVGPRSADFCHKRLELCFVDLAVEVQRQIIDSNPVLGYRIVWQVFSNECTEFVFIYMYGGDVEAVENSIDNNGSSFCNAVKSLQPIRTTVTK